MAASTHATGDVPSSKGVHRRGRPGDGVSVTGVVSSRVDVRHEGSGGAVVVTYLTRLTQEAS